MTKIMLVEDDKSLREIYSIRLVAEGYEVVSAGDGEEALAMAVKEQPNLIVSDVMMPKISGFDMLDILRSTPETKNIHVIMMTALSSEDQRQRGENLGADRYLVKSQVGIEDVINAVHEVLNDKSASAGGDGAPAAPGAPVSPESTAAPGAPAAPIMGAPTPAAAPAPGAAEPVATSPVPAAPGPAPVAPAPGPDAVAPAPVAPAPTAPAPSPEPQIGAPLNAPSQGTELTNMAPNF